MNVAEYFNRRNEKHCIKAGITKTGKKQYYVVKKLSKVLPEELLQEIPSGYEFHELPRDAMVVLRKIPVYNINDAEVEIVKSAMKQHEAVLDYIIEKAADCITIYTGCIDKVRYFSEISPYFTSLNLKTIQHYEDVLRFEKKKQIYYAQRFCYLSSIDVSGILTDNEQ
jgi:hypothetical protein